MHDLRSRSISALLVMFAIVFSAVAPVAAQSSSWASVTSVRDLTGNSNLQSGQALIAGDAYNMTIKVTVPNTQTNSKFQVSLDGFMLPKGPQFWYLNTPSYNGYDPNNFTAGMHAVSFNQVQGTLSLSVLFVVPVNMTIQHAGSLQLHFPLSNYKVIDVTVPGSSVGSVTETIEDQTISTYLSTYQAKSTLVSSGQVDRAYSQFVAGVLNSSKVLYNMGFAELATSLLNIVTPSTFPAPPNSTLLMALMAAAAVLAILTVVFLVMALRGRGKSQYIASVDGDMGKELATLEVTASKYDKSLADRLKALRDKLSETS